MSGTCMQSTVGMEPNWARVPPHVPTYPNPPAYFRYTHSYLFKPKLKIYVTLPVKLSLYIYVLEFALNLEKETNKG